MNETIPYLPGLSPVAGKELCARFDGGRLSSDGGILLFAGIERRLGIAELLASRVTDARNPASTTHSYADMIRARMFAIACGYEDCRPEFAFDRRTCYATGDRKWSSGESRLRMDLKWI